jgi:hypothetical protein
MLKSDEESEKEKLEFEEMMNYDALSDDEKYLQSQKIKDESNT